VSRPALKLLIHLPVRRGIAPLAVRNAFDDEVATAVTVAFFMALKNASDRRFARHTNAAL